MLVPPLKWEKGRSLENGSTDHLVGDGSVVQDGRPGRKVREKTEDENTVQLNSQTFDSNEGRGKTTWCQKLVASKTQVDPSM